jgi:hypothetical protein
MRSFEDRTFKDLHDEDLRKPLANAVLTRCTFDFCGVGFSAKVPSKRRTIRNVVLRDCTIFGNCLLGPVVLDNVQVENLKAGGRHPQFVVEGAVFKHVSFGGACRGSLRLTEIEDPLGLEDKRRLELFGRANAAFYENVDWALDISHAEWAGLEIRCRIPARLIRRDAETQFVVRRDKVLAKDRAWRGGMYHFDLEYMLRHGLEERVLVAPRGSKRFKEWLKALQKLRKAGVAEPD